MSEQRPQNITRRRFVRDVGLATIAAGNLPAGPAVAARTRRRGRARPTVAVIGGGVAGLTAAHELAERGFEVTVYERKALGGKARSIPVPGSAVGGRRPLPGEHGFRAVFGFYNHLPDTLRRIPDSVAGRSVHANLVGTGQPVGARPDGREDITSVNILPLPGPPDPLTVDSLYRQLVAAGQLYLDIPPHELAFLAARASCT